MTDIIISGGLPDNIENKINDLINVKLSKIASDNVPNLKCPKLKTIQFTNCSFKDPTNLSAIRSQEI